MKQARRNTLIALSFIICLLSFSTTLCSCSSDDETTTDTQEDSNGRRMRQLTISNVSMATRATIDPLTFAAAWATTDRPTYINLSAQPELRYGTLTPSAAVASTTLTGNVYCKQDDNIAIILPKVTPVLPSGGSPYFTIDLSGQKGTLDDIGTRYHYIYGTGTVTSTDGGTATATITNTKSLLSLCKFTFTHNNSPISVKSMQIGWGSTGSAGYPQTGTVSLDDPENVVAQGDTPNGSLTITLDNANAEGVVYVALFPCNEKLTFHFTVSDGTNTYTATKKAIMLEGKYYEVTIKVTQ